MRALGMRVGRHGRAETKFVTTSRATERRRAGTRDVPRASIATDVGATAITLSAATVAVSSIKWAEYSGTVNKLLSRKLIHSIAGPGFLLFWPLFGDTPGSQIICAITPVANAVSLFLAGSSMLPDSKSVSAISRTGDARKLLQGPLYYCIVLTLVTIFLWRHSLTSIAVTSVMCMGDGLADIVGRRFGQQKERKLPWSSSKSYPGSFAMFSGGFLASAALTAYFGYFDLVTYDEWTFATLAGISLAATVLESLDDFVVVDDNISVPALVAVLGCWLL